MSILAQQLSKLKLNAALSIAPGAPKPSLLLDQWTAKQTTVDVLHTMAVLGYGEIRREVLLCARGLADELLGEGYKEVNRNKLSKEENRELGGKLVKFMLGISGLFLNRGCQAVLEYLLRNFNVHVFEAEQLVMIFLQYWEQDSFVKLVQNIEIKSTNLQFVKNFQEKKQINLTYLIKSLSYSRSLVESLLLLTRKYIKQQSLQSEEIEIELQTRPTGAPLHTQHSSLLKRDPKQFLLMVLCLMLQRKITTFNKQICEFCIFASRDDDEEVYSMAMMLSISVLASQTEGHSGWIGRVVANLLGKGEVIEFGVFQFMVVLWQRWPQLLTDDITEVVLGKQHFVQHVGGFSRSLYMMFFALWHYYLKEGVQNKGVAMQVLNLIALKIKQEQFVKVHGVVYYGQLFGAAHRGYENLAKNQQKALIKFIKAQLLYEYGQYINEGQSTPLVGVFGKQQLSKDGSIDMSTVRQVRIEPQPNEQAKKSTMQPQEQSEQQPEPTPAPSEAATLLKIFNSHSKNVLTEVNLSHPQTLNLAIQLITAYYLPSEAQTQALPLTPALKNRLLQSPQLYPLYTQAYAVMDLARRDYHTLIRYTPQHGSIDLCYKILLLHSEDNEAGADLLFRQLSSKTIHRLSALAPTHYKQVMTCLNRLYGRYCRNTQVEMLKGLNELMLRASAGVIGAVGRGKGKYYRLIACHARFMARLTCSQVYRHGYALDTYRRLLEIFGTENGYWFVIGAAEMLATNIKDKKLFANFIDLVLVPSLQIEEGKEQLAEAIGLRNVLRMMHTLDKCLIFCYEMLEESKEGAQKGEQGEKENEGAVNGIELQTGIAKKMITNFFGLTSTKDKRAIVRKLLLFLSFFFKSYKFTEIFKQILTTITRKQQLKLSAIASKMYNVLVTLFTQTSGPLRQTISTAKVNILKLFPLQLKVDVLGPLLPLNQVYNQLAVELQQHGSRKFDNLTYYINIVPHQPSEEWCKFATQCIKRGYFPSEDNSKAILALSQKTEDNTNLIKFIVFMTEYAREESLGLLSQMMKIVFKQCSELNDYSLAVLFKVTRNLRQFVDPYLNDIFRIGINVGSENVKKFVDGIVEVFTAPTLVTLVKNHAKTVENFSNFSYFLNKISSKVTFESIWKTTQNFFSRSLASLVQSEASFEQLHNEQSDIFVTQALKMNDDQLRKVIIDYVRWSAERTNSDSIENLHFNSRKNLLLVIFEKLTNKLGELFLHYYGYIFDDLIKDIQSLKIMQESKNAYIAEKAGKRQRPMSQYALQCTSSHLKQLLQTLKSLFDADIENQFMDSIKFDALSPELASIFNLTKFETHYPALTKQYLTPCLISLFTHTKDDYKLKTINTEILRLLRTKDQRISAAIFAFYDEVITHIDYRFLIFTDEMTPLLIEASSTRNAGVKKSVESIIYKIQNLSGEKIGGSGQK